MANNTKAQNEPTAPVPLPTKQTEHRDSDAQGHLLVVQIGHNDERERQTGLPRLAHSLRQQTVGARLPAGGSYALRFAGGVDPLDFAAFQVCYLGQNVTADPFCDACPPGPAHQAIFPYSRPISANIRVRCVVIPVGD